MLLDRQAPTASRDLFFVPFTNNCKSLIQRDGCGTPDQHAPEKCLCRRTMTQRRRDARQGDAAVHLHCWGK